MKCVGFGQKEGKCNNEAGTDWTPYWCIECDKERREHITKQLENLCNEMSNKRRYRS